MKKKLLNRRTFIKKTSPGIAGAAALTAAGGSSLYSDVVKKTDVPALLGGKPVLTKPFPSWPVYDDTDVQMLLDAYNSKKWCRLGATRVDTFEKKFSKLMGVPFCRTTNSGTTALYTSLSVLGVGPGDEVILPPYTFVATLNVIPILHALPVFVDTDPETFQINADLIEERITEHTRAIIPVHIGGGAADMDKIMAVSKKYNIPVVEDACQAWLGEWKGKKLGSMGDTGCFSFQASKNLNSGEGGAIISSNEELMDLCTAFTNNGRPPKSKSATLSGYPYPGSNHRMTEFQGAVLLGQIRRLEEQQNLRSENAAYLDGLLKDIPGISPCKKYPGQTRHAYHLYMMIYDKNYFNGLNKNKFARAMRAEGIPVSTGYTPLNKQGVIEYHLDSRAFKTVFSKERLEKYRRENHCPANDKVCKETGLWLGQNVLLGTKKDMEDIASAVVKVQKNSVKLI